MTVSPENTYRDLHARRYDLIYADKPYAEEAALVAELLDQAGAPRGALLDLACGTGRHLREFADLGYDVTGVDYNADLLDAARRNVPGAALHRADMRALDLGPSRFQAITCLFDSIGYAQSNEAVVASLERAHAHLEETGALVVEFLHAPAVVRHAAPARLRRWALPEGGELVRASETELDLANDLMRVSYELFEFDAGGGLADRSADRQVNRYFSAETMRALMSLAGLTVDRIVPAHGSGSCADDAAWHLLAVARPASR